MMKRICPTFVRWRDAVLAIAIVMCALLGSARCETGNTALVVQQSPFQGGRITPDVGVHQFDLYTNVTLTAVPRAGYQFVYWLGDVSDPTVSRTTVYLDGPKIVIAVFERARYGLLTPGEWPYTASVGGMFASAPGFGRGGFGGGGGRRPSGRGAARTAPPSEEEPEGDFPVPEDLEGDFPVPVPEPAVVFMLGLGGLAVLRKRHVK
ncbi:MAG: InlB B-repeat-containing protein [Planctomycetota bacterium]